MREWITRHDTAAFLVLTFGISWPLWLASGALGRGVIRVPDLRWLVAQVGVFAPAVAGMIVGSCCERGRGRRALRTLAFVYAPAAALGLAIATRGYGSFLVIGPSWSWALVALGVWSLVWFGRGTNRLVSWPGLPAGGWQVTGWSVGAALGAWLAYLLAWRLTALSSPAAAVGAVFATAAAVPFRDLTPLGAVYAVAMNLSFGGSLGEEPGWRGAWLPRLLASRGVLGATLVISFWWALWHAPIDLAQGFAAPGVGGLVARQLWTAPLAVLFTWVTVRAGGSLLPAMALHTALNAVSDFGPIDPAHYARATMLFFVVALLVAVAVLVLDRRMSTFLHET